MNNEAGAAGKLSANSWIDYIERSRVLGEGLDRERAEALQRCDGPVSTASIKRPFSSLLIHGVCPER